MQNSTKVNLLKFELSFFMSYFYKSVIITQVNILEAKTENLIFITHDSLLSHYGEKYILYLN